MQPALERYVEDRLAEGVAAGDVLEELIDRGMPPVEARELVMAKLPDTPLPPRETFWSVAYVFFLCLAAVGMIVAKIAMGILR